MSAINLSMVVEVDTKQLESMREKMDKLDAQLLEKLEKVSTSMTKLLEKAGYTWLDNMNRLSKSFSNMVEVSKIGTVAIFKQLEGVNEKLNELIKSFDDFKLRLSKNPSGPENFFSSTTVDIISLTSSLVFLSKAAGNVYALLIAIAPLIGYALKKAFDDISKSALKEMSETYKVAETLDALLWAANEGLEEAKYIYNEIREISNRPILPSVFEIFSMGNHAFTKTMGVVNAIDAVRKAGYGPLLDEIVKGYKHYLEKTKAASDETKSFADLINSLAGPFGALSQANMDLYSVMDKYGITSLTKLNDETKTLLSEYDLMQSHTTMNVALTEQFADAVAALIEQYRMLGKDAPAALEELYYKSSMNKQLLDNIPAGPDFSKTAGLMDQDIQYKLLANIPKPTFNYDLIPDPFAPSSKTETAKDSGFFGGLWSSFKSGVDDLKKQFGFGEGKGLLGNLFGGKDTGGGLFGMLGSLGGPQSGIVGMLQSVTSMIPGIGTMISGVIGGIGTAFNALKSLFGGLTEEEKVAKDVTRDLGVSISEELAKKIADTSKDVGDRFTAVTMHLGDIMRETDITADNFDTFASRARDVFSLLETGMMNSAQATSTLNDVFPQLAEEADKLGITFNKNMIDMIQLSRQFGLEVESIKQYVEEKLGIAVQGLTTATQNLGEIGQAEFDRLARAAAATFQELMKNGSDIASVIDQMKEVIANLGKAQEEYGLKGSAAFNQLKRYGNLVETNRSVIESVKGMTDVYTSLAQVGGMNQKLFNDWQTDTLSNYDKLIAGGFKQNEALAMMAPSLQALKEAHETMGLKIDDNTRALIEQADAAGLLKADPMQQMTDAVIEMTDSVDRLIDYLSGSSPPCGSLIESFGTALEYTKSYGRELINAFSPLPVQNLISKMGEIPKEIGVHVGYTYDEYAGPYGGSYGGYGGGYDGGTGPGGKPYEAQHGGIFTVPTHLLVGENPAYNPEVVLNRFQLERLLTQSPAPARNLNEGSSSAPTIINVYVAGEKVESVILPMLKQASRDGKVKIDPRAIEE